MFHQLQYNPCYFFFPYNNNKKLKKKKKKTKQKSDTSYCNWYKIKWNTNNETKDFSVPLYTLLITIHHVYDFKL